MTTEEIEEFKKFFGDRLLGLLTRAYGELKAIADEKPKDESARLFEAGKLGRVLILLMKDGTALRDEALRKIIPDPTQTEKKNGGKT